MPAFAPTSLLRFGSTLTYPSASPGALRFGVTYSTPNRERRRLTAAEDASAAAVFVQESSAPVLWDDWPDGFDYVCGHCGEMVLVSGIAEDQVWDVAFRCFACKRVSLSPSLPPGMALPPGRVLVPREMFPVSVTTGIALRRQTVVGQAAEERRQAEAGPPGATFGVMPNRPLPPESDAPHLQRLIDELRGLLGEVFDTLDRKDQRRRASGTTKRHPLMVSVQDIRTAIATFATPTPTVDHWPVMELVTLLDTLKRWKNHPAWAALVRGLVNEYPHTVLTLAAATALTDLGNGVVFHVTRGGRAADLLLVVGARQRVAVEVKVRDALRTPASPVGYDRLLTEIRAAVKAARTGAKGQLSRQHAALLILGGFHLAQADLDAFQQAAADYLRDAQAKRRHAHLMGIGLVAFGTTLTRGSVWAVRAHLHLPVVANPGYRGSIPLKTGTVPPPMG